VIATTVCSDIAHVVRLLQEQADSGFWGTAKVSFKDGTVERVEVVMTLKPGEITGRNLTWVKDS
jgi:hypothetical protein